jgi:hypothetical protein
MKRHARQEAVLDVYQLALAAVLFASPWLFAFAQSEATMDARISGVLVAAVSVIALLMFREWEEWINVVLGAWVIASPWILGFAHTTAAHVMIAIGIVIVYLALLEVWLTHKDGVYHNDTPKQPSAMR